MSWIQVIFDFIGRFWPFVIIYSYQMGVRFWCGHDTKLVGPGLYMFIPGLGHIEAVNVREDILRLENQNLTTKDGKPIQISTNVRYRIEDARAAFCNVQFVMNNLGDEARTHMATQIREYNFDELLAAQGDLEETCLEAINEAAAEWGVVVTNVGLADFIITKSLSVAKV